MLFMPHSLGTSVARRPLTPKIMPRCGNPHVRNYRLHLRFLLRSCGWLHRPSHRWLPHLFSTFLLDTCRTYFAPETLVWGVFCSSAITPHGNSRIGLYYLQRLSINEGHCYRSVGELWWRRWVLHPRPVYLLVCFIEYSIYTPRIFPAFPASSEPPSRKCCSTCSK